MEMTETLNKEIAQFIKEKFIYGGEMTNDLSLTETGILDSMGVISLITFIEDKYKVEVDDEEISQSNFGSINKIVGFIQTKLKK
jgi:acyl carrier protein